MSSLTSHSWEIRTCDVLEGLRSLPDASVQCCVTSPPYFALRDYGVDGQIGLEKTPDEYVAKMVEVFGEVRRVLRDDGTLWMNIGDSYAANGNGGGSVFDKGRTDGRPSNEKDKARGRESRLARIPSGCKIKDLLGIPWLLAFALRSDGWYLRSEIVWHKRSPMPESVTDRPTKAHEQIFLLSKSPRYFYDSVASAEEATGGARGSSFITGKTVHNRENCSKKPREDSTSTRNMRSVWTLSSEPYKGAHFATYPTELVRRCLLAGTGEKGCCAVCGAPWVRVTKKERRATRPGTNSKVHQLATAEGSPSWTHNGDVSPNRDPERHCTETVTVGWGPGCKCNGGIIPCLVLDPFSGAGTTCVVARRLGLRFIGFELNATYAEMARRRVIDDQPLLNAG